MTAEPNESELKLLSLLVPGAVQYDLHHGALAELREHVAKETANLQNMLEVERRLRTKEKDSLENKLNAMRLVCGTTDANKFETALDRKISQIAARDALIQRIRKSVDLYRSATTWNEEMPMEEFERVASELNDALAASPESTAKEQECPHVVKGGEGTRYCSLAESSVKQLSETAERYRLVTLKQDVQISALTKDRDEAVERYRDIRDAQRVNDMRLLSHFRRDHPVK